MSSPEGKQLYNLVIALLDTELSDDEIVERLRKSAAGRRRSFRVADRMLRQTGHVMEARPMYRAWRLVTLAAGRSPQPLTPADEDGFGTIDAFEALSEDEQIERLMSELPELASYRSELEFGRKKESLADIVLRTMRLIGPNSNATGFLGRSTTAQDVAQQFLLEVGGALDGYEDEDDVDADE